MKTRLDQLVFINSILGRLEIILFKFNKQIFIFFIPEYEINKVFKDLITVVKYIRTPLYFKFMVKILQ